MYLIDYTYVERVKSEILLPSRFGRSFVLADGDASGRFGLIKMSIWRFQTARVAGSCTSFHFWQRTHEFIAPPANSLFSNQYFFLPSPPFGVTRHVLTATRRAGVKIWQQGIYVSQTKAFV